MLAPLLSAPAPIGRPSCWPLRLILDGILYVLRTGCASRRLPLDCPPWRTGHRWSLSLSQAGVFKRVVREGREKH
jgi:transposase